MTEVATFSPPIAAHIVRALNGVELKVPKPVIVIAMTPTQRAFCIEADGEPSTCAFAQLNFDVRFDSNEGRWTDLSEPDEINDG